MHVSSSSGANNNFATKFSAEKYGQIKDIYGNVFLIKGKKRDDAIVKSASTYHTWCMWDTMHVRLFRLEERIIFLADRCSSQAQPRTHASSWGALATVYRFRFFRAKSQSDTTLSRSISLKNTKNKCLASFFNFGLRAFHTCRTSQLQKLVSNISF